MPNYNSKVVLSDGTVLMDISSDTVTAAKMLRGTTAHDKSGAPVTGSCDYNADTSNDTVTSDVLLSGSTAHNASGQAVTGGMTNRGAVSGTISTKDGTYTVPQGYHDGSGAVGIAATEKAKLVPNNIREGVTVLGVEGTMSGSESEKPQAKSVTPSFAQQNITPDAAYTCLSEVTVAAIAVSYTDNAGGGKTVTIGA